MSEKNLVIVESPAKAKTIEKFLGKEYTVKSSFGHIRDLVKKNLGIEIENGFEPQYEVSADKKKIVAELKKLSKNAETVWLASDEDREGEAIAWHLQQTLDLNISKTKRIVFHEITKNAILEAVKNPRTVDINLVNAQQARRVLDRLVGFQLSPLLWKKVKPNLSAGRVQSVAVRLLVEREREVNNFRADAYFKVIAEFLLRDDKTKKLKAELNHRFKTAQDAENFLNACQQASFQISDIQTKPGRKSPAPPFTTSTLQQEAARKLGFSVSQTMSIAQKLYESGQITYMRTDSVNLSQLALHTTKATIIEEYGDKYVHTRQYQTKSKGAQEAHEAIRPTYIDNPTATGGRNEQRLYDLIRKRTLASQMSDALLEKTTITIAISTNPNLFLATGEVILFDGFLKAYMESTDDENDTSKAGGEGILPSLKTNDLLEYQLIEAVERFSLKPARYTEAALVKKLEELGIGRPSTYAPTITTIQNRGYVVKEDKPGTTREYAYLALKPKKGLIIETREEITGSEKSKLFPTDIGIVVNDFLMDNFKEIMDYNFTASVEKDFDEIADGKLIWNKMIGDFYSPFLEQIKVTGDSAQIGNGMRMLGIDPATGKEVSVRIGRFGPMAQIGENNKETNEKALYSPLRSDQSIDTITLEEALTLFKLPRKLGLYENTEILVSNGRFGPYLKHGSAFYSLKKEDDPYTIEIQRAIQLIDEKRVAEANSVLKTFTEDPLLIVREGRWGPYIKHGKDNFKLPKNTDINKLTIEDCRKIMLETGKPAKKRKK
ncbi:MAG: type I DNA topoisomerase [Bacteroidales bacterium]|nr:type I DNA topoisomerase [Bacteroidales bacterium]